MVFSQFWSGALCADSLGFHCLLTLSVSHSIAPFGWVGTLSAHKKVSTITPMPGIRSSTVRVSGSVKHTAVKKQKGTLLAATERDDATIEKRQCDSRKEQGKHSLHHATQTSTHSM